MKLMQVQVGDESHVGASLLPGLVVDLTLLGERLPEARGLGASIQGILAAQRLAKVEEILEQLRGNERLRSEFRDAGVIEDEENLRLLPPFSRPLVISTGGGYREHLKEMASGGTPEAPEVPGGFIKCVASIAGPHNPIILPANAPDMVDWEGEFACVIGKKCHQVSVEEAMEYVAGYTLINDVSARDWVNPFLTRPGTPFEISRRAGMNLMGKQFPTFCPMGPSFVTKNELPDPLNVTLTTRVNGELMQNAHTSALVFGIPEIVSYFSQWYEFQPGDVITTGSPAGVGYAQNPQRFLRPGDIVEVNVEPIGTLRNQVVASVKRREHEQL